MLVDRAMRVYFQFLLEGGYGHDRSKGLCRTREIVHRAVLSLKDAGNHSVVGLADSLTPCRRAAVVGARYQPKVGAELSAKLAEQITRGRIVRARARARNTDSWRSSYQFPPTKRSFPPKKGG